MSDRAGANLRDRALLPVFIPVAALLVTEIVVFSMSRVLLAAGHMPAVGAAVAVALGILGGSAIVAARPRVRSTTIIGLLGVLLVGIVAVGVVAAQRGAYYEHEAAADLPGVAVGAANLAFDTDTIELPTGGAIIHFENADSVPHNIAVFPDEGTLDQVLFRGPIIEGGTMVDYEVDVEPGTYFFHCDVHPNMKGTVEVG